MSPSSLLGFNEDLSKDAVGFCGLPEGALVRVCMPHRLTPREALARIFPGYDLNMYDTKMADRALAWLDECGYQIVPKDQVMLAPEPAAEDQQRAPELR